jgi:hypothetical protein
MLTVRAGLARLSQWTRNILVADVPDDIAACEFDCRKTQCPEGEWEHCKRRLTHAAAGELSRARTDKRHTPVT